MSRGQKRSYNGNTQNVYGNNAEGFYDEFGVGVRENQARPSPYYYNNNRGGGRGGTRKHFCYLNADFFQANSVELQNTLNAGGGNASSFRRRVGWGVGNKWSSGQAQSRKDNSQNQNNPRSRIIDTELEDVEEDKDLLDYSKIEDTRDISVTVSSMRSEDTTMELENGSNRPRSRDNRSDRNSAKQRRHRENSRKHKKSRSSRYSKKSRRHDQIEDVEESADMTDISSSEDEDGEDLRYALVRHKITRKKSRREPGEIGDSPQTPSVCSSSQRDENSPPIRKKTSSKSKCVGQESSTDGSRPESAESDSSLALQLRKMEELKLALSHEQEKIKKAQNSKLHNNEQQLRICSTPSTVVIANNVEGKSKEKRTGNATFTGVLHEDQMSEISPVSSQNSVSSKLVIDETILLPVSIPSTPLPTEKSSIPTTPNNSTAVSDNSKRLSKEENTNSASVSLNGASPSIQGTPNLNILDTTTFEQASISQTSVNESKDKETMATIDKIPEELPIVPRKELVNWKFQYEKLKKEHQAQAEKLKEKDKCISSLKLELKATNDDMDAKIKVMRGKKTQMENELEALKKSNSKLEKSLKDVEQKQRKSETDIKIKDGEIEALKRTADSTDNNKHDMQLIFAMAYQDRLFLEVEKLRSVYETEILKLQEYYESRLNFFKNQAMHGSFVAMSPNNFPKGCVVTPMNINQGQGHQGIPIPVDQQGNPRQESRPMMGMFASHLGPPESAAPPLLTAPQTVNNRTRLPIFMNQMARRIQMGLDPTGSNQCGGNASTVTAANNSSQTQNPQQLQQTNNSGSSNQCGGTMNNSNQSSFNGR